MYTYVFLGMYFDIIIIMFLISAFLFSARNGI